MSCQVRATAVLLVGLILVFEKVIILLAFQIFHQQTCCGQMIDPAFVSLRVLATLPLQILQKRHTHFAAWFSVPGTSISPAEKLPLSVGGLSEAN